MKKAPWFHFIMSMMSFFLAVMSPPHNVIACLLIVAGLAFGMIWAFMD